MHRFDKSVHMVIPFSFYLIRTWPNLPVRAKEYLIIRTSTILDLFHLLQPKFNSINSINNRPIRA